jgi:hypothetical protein
VGKIEPALTALKAPSRALVGTHSGAHAFSQHVHPREIAVKTTSQTRVPGNQRGPASYAIGAALVTLGAAGVVLLVLHLAASNAT